MNELSSKLSSNADNNRNGTSTHSSCTNSDEEVDPIDDIIDYLVRCTKVSFKTAHVNEKQLRTSDKVRMFQKMYRESPERFLAQYGKYLAPKHMEYFSKLTITMDEVGERFQKCVNELNVYHSEESRRKRTRNRRFRAMAKLKMEGDYFSDKEMMYRNPLLYEQLVGQYLTQEEVSERDGVDSSNLTLLNMILETVDRNEMRVKKNEQIIIDKDDVNSDCSIDDEDDEKHQRQGGAWGAFDVPDCKDTKPEKRKQVCISASEQALLHEEFRQEMYSSFIDGQDPEVDYNSIDNDEQLDDIDQVSRDAEDKYFDSEPVDIDNLEQHMKLVDVYGRKSGSDGQSHDALDEFMDHLNKISYNI